MRSDCEDIRWDLLGDWDMMMRKERRERKKDKEHVIGAYHQDVMNKERRIRVRPS